MSFNYTKSAATAKKLLIKFGQAVTLRSYTEGTYDTSNAQVTNTYSDTTRKAAILDFGEAQVNIRGTLVQVGDKRCLMDADATVNQQDHIIVGSTEYTIVSIGEVNPAGTRVLYDLHIRT